MTDSNSTALPTRWIDRIEGRLVTAERTLLTVLVLSMTLLGFLQIVLRKTSLGGLLWADTFLRHLVLWVAFLGACLAAAQNKHFGADLSDRLFTGRFRLVAQLVASLFTVAVCALLTSASIAFVAEEFRSASTLFTLGALRVPASLFEIILPLGFLLLLVHYALKVVGTIQELRR